MQATAAQQSVGVPACVLWATGLVAPRRVGVRGLGQAKADAGRQYLEHAKVQGGGARCFRGRLEGGSMEGGPRRGGAVGDEVVAGGRARDDDYRAVGAAKVNVTAD